MFYSEWCVHCQQSKPQFQKLINTYNGPVKIMMIDSEAPENKDLVKSQNIKGFPTIRYYPSGISQNYQEYGGGRNVDNFMQFLNQIQASQSSNQNMQSNTESM
jgi:thiol-disulfide isomerase/thioredoxin